MKKILLSLAIITALSGCVSANTNEVNSNLKQNFIRRANFITTDKKDKYGDVVGTNKALFFDTVFSNSAVNAGKGYGYIGFYKDNITINFRNYDSFEDYELVVLYLKNEKGEETKVNAYHSFIEDNFDFGNQKSNFLNFLNKSKEVKVYAKAYDYYDSNLSNYISETYQFKIELSK